MEGLRLQRVLPLWTDAPCWSLRPRGGEGSWVAGSLSPDRDGAQASRRTGRCWVGGHGGGGGAPGAVSAGGSQLLHLPKPQLCFALEGVTVSGFTPSSGLSTPTPLRTQLPRDRLQGAVHARCLHPDARPQRTTRSGQAPTTMEALPEPGPGPPQPVPRGCAGRGLPDTSARK